MAHAIHAAVVQAEVRAEDAARFELRVIALAPGLSMLPLHDRWCDAWAERLAAPGFVAERPQLDARVVHRVVEALAPGRRFAVIETDYFGGAGEQSAAVYQGGEVVMAPTTGAIGPINAALRLLGVQARGGADEFDTVGLRRWRRFDDDDAAPGAR